ncbi:MAG: SNF2-related protein [Anaerolineales bacterium]|nr:SNF2-related protein [Anaerolineales bacterium]
MPLPAALQARLRPYQRRGFAWLYRNARAGLGSIIADDMGLGKTLQVIAAIARLKEDGELEAGKALIIVPTSLLTNWQREVERFAPALAVAIYHGPGRRLAHKARPGYPAHQLRRRPQRCRATQEAVHGGCWWSTNRRTSRTPPRSRPAPSSPSRPAPPSP